MKTPIALALALLCAALASAADITLKDGRVLEDAVVLKQDAGTITVRHSGGFTQFEKTKLPDDLATQYPVDEAAAAQQRSAELASIRKRTAERAAAAKQNQDAAVARRVAEQSTPAYKQAQAIRGAVGDFIGRRHGRPQRTGANGWRFNQPHYTLSKPVEVPGTTNQWTVDADVEVGDEKYSSTATVAYLYAQYVVMLFDPR